ncbi:M20/M25/M40 family metallo-hydrolase [Chryseobacterium carnipullorum]|uniref:Carboxypeptidase Q n=1 Tax=Chryseobacterium carnipullorum TaxID=1124835 RepID=A0A376E152_CHRCU|nr:M20/M25/M40 family metallo-hydrolase [Chryseobacterium carnipullorum]AZA50488.1 M20/M25/M40 family metallo-hydrolase [Chryseobacterium carnipullorum]AZA65355.1 M20/M25/M40 family metallo-hydrolase [Chryseobacterium carnipullorum]STC99865.1 Bacterial leucyl aminopeptidase precursor [Chryseobacterium carnipullorum]
MKKIIGTSLLCLGMAVFGQSKEDSIQFSKISTEILNNGKGYTELRDLSKNIGHRLSGSEAYEKAVKWAEQKLRDAGADKVWLQEVMVPVWTRGKESLQIKTADGKWKGLKMLSLGNSEGTGGRDVSGEIIIVKSMEEYDKLSVDQVKDKIVFFNYPFSQSFVETFRGYSDAAKYRVTAASLTAKKGGKFAIVRSLSSAFDDVPHTGGMRYEDQVLKIPAIAIGTTTADELEALLKTQKVTAKLNSNCGMKGEKLSHSVIGEITGKKDQNVIVVGGHLDSWDVGEGAHDDGAGIVQSIEVLRTFKKLGIKNNHTIRVVCFANEENGVKGGIQYGKTAKEKNEKHLFAIESDAGGFAPRGIALEMDEEKRQQIKSWTGLFLPYGVYNFEGKYSGTDIYPLHDMGVPTAELVPDSQRYFDIHHTEEDTFEKVNRRELLLGATAMTQIIYMIDKNW